MKFVEKFSLRCRGAVEQAPDDDVNGSLLVGETAIAQFEDRKRAPRYGIDDVKVFPAVLNGEKGFLVEKTWNPAKGYSAYGVEEIFVGQHDGVTMLLEHGVYDNAFDRT